jgi:heterodisulfide reductase subunit B
VNIPSAHSAVSANAEVIATACPLCQTNLERCQEEVSGAYGTSYAVPVLNFTQLLGLALGVAEKRLGTGKELVSAWAILKRPTSSAAPAST